MQIDRSLFNYRRRLGANWAPPLHLLQYFHTNLHPVGMSARTNGAFLFLFFFCVCVGVFKLSTCVLLPFLFSLPPSLKLGPYVDVFGCVNESPTAKALDRVQCVFTIKMKKKINPPLQL